MTAEREAQFRKLVEQFPESPMGHFSLGKLLLEQGHYPEAIGQLTVATRLDPAYAAALVTLGEALRSSGQLQQARDTWERARARAPEQNHPSLAEEVDGLLAELPPSTG